MAKLNVYLFGDNTGVAYYRIHSPAKWLKKSGLVNVRSSEWRWTEETENIKFPTMEELNDIAHWADIIVFQRHDILQVISTFCGIGELFNMPIVLDSDDNIEAVRPFNPGYRGYHPGSEALLWGKKVVEKVDAITVSTDNLYELHKGDCDLVYVLPNSLDIDWRSKFKPKEHKGINLGWLGSAAHYENLQIIEKPVLDILRKHKDVTFWTMDFFEKALWKDVDKDLRKRIKRVPWATFKQWPKNLAKLSLDIGLAPACDNEFNRAKSNLRYLEYSMNETAVIASPVEAYKCIEHEKTGLHAKEKHEWFDAMDRLITDEKLRKELGKNARQDTVDNYNMEKNIKLWVNTYVDIVEKFEKKNGHKKFYYPIREE